MDIRTLLDPTLLGWTVLLILTASVGKFVGALAGGWLSGLKTWQALALATGLNARGSTEVIVASIGLSMGFLTHELYTMIVAMAVITTIVMPPMLRAALSRVPVSAEEKARLDKEEAEERQSVPKMERALVVVDDSANGRLAAHLAGVFSAGEHIATTVMKLEGFAGRGREPARKMVLDTAEAVTGEPETGAGAPEEPVLSAPELVRAKPSADLAAIEAEAAKGYHIAFVGLERPFRAEGGGFSDHLRQFIGAFDEPCAITLNGEGFNAPRDAGLKILVPSGGTAQAVLATEIAVALARASGGQVSVLHVTDPRDGLRGGTTHARWAAATVLGSARRLGAQGGVAIDARAVAHSFPARAIAQEARSGSYDLVVVGVGVRRGQRKFLGPRGAALVREVDAPLLVIAQ
jgi:nucleotide-binding universal stress UspA family protein